MLKETIILSIAYLFISICILVSQSQFKGKLIAVFGIYTFMIFLLFSISPLTKKNLK